MKPGYKQTEVGVIPEEWEDTTVGAMIAAGIIEKPLDGNHGNIHPKSGDFVDWGIPFVMANNVKGGGVDLVNCSFIRKQQADSLQKGFSITGDVLLTHKATIGNTAVVGEMGFPYIMLTPQVTYYRVNDESRLSNLYLRHYFETVGFQSVLRALAGGGTRSYIGISAQHQLPVIFPTSLPEQRAIAEALSDVDGLLGGLDRLIAKKRDLKQAAMQQLLTGQTRLPGFHGEWKFHILGNIGRFKNGLNKDSSAFGHGFAFVNLMDVFGVNSISATTHLGLVDSTKLDREVYDLRRGDVLFIRSSVKPSGVGLTALVEANLEDAVYSGFMIRFRDEGVLDLGFKKHCFYEENFRRKVIAASSVSANTNINQNALKQLTLPLPPTKEEQTAIAQILSDMDAELTALEQRQEKTLALKQAMMQELLTGNTRLI